MPAQVSVFPHDRSERWILAPGVASTRQIELRNDSDSPVECHLRVEEPSTASASPAVLTIAPHHLRTADIIFLANWSPARHQRIVATVRDPQGNQLATFAHEIAPADSSDCTLSLGWKGERLVDGALAGFILSCSISSRSATPRRFEIDFAPHPSLRFPERKTMTLAPGESAAFEVPVAWNRSVRDVAGWNHPRTIEAFVPVSDGRRTDTLSWERIEERLVRFLTADDFEAKAMVVERSAKPSPFDKPHGQLKYSELLELKTLEQGVVGGAPGRVLRRQNAGQTREPGKRRVPLGPLLISAIALVTLGVGFFWYPRLQEAQPVSARLKVTSPVARAAVTRNAKHPARSVAAGPIATPAWMNVATATVNPAPASARNSVATARRPQSLALAPQPKPAAPIDRSAIVALSGVDAAFAPGGRAVNIVWSSTAQASALVELLDATGKVIASRSVTGSRSDSTLRLPKGYRGSVSVEVTAIGYHGERAVQGASLGPPG